MTARMLSYHSDFIVSCQRRQCHLRNLLASLKHAEDNARRHPSASARSNVDFQADNLADFMYRNCGFPKGLPKPAKRYVPVSKEQAQHEFNAVLRSIPLPRAPL